MTIGTLPPLPTYMSQGDETGSWPAPPLLAIGSSSAQIPTDIAPVVADTGPSGDQTLTPRTEADFLDTEQRFKRLMTLFGLNY